MGELLDYAPIARRSVRDPPVPAPDPQTAGDRRQRGGLLVVGDAHEREQRRLVGPLLTAAFILQVTPSIWTAYRTERPTGVSHGTWMLIFGELSCWTIFGTHNSDPSLIVLGLTGVAASVLMLTRIQRTGGQEGKERPAGDLPAAHAPDARA